MDDFTDKQIIEFCSTEDNCIKYMYHWISKNKGFYNCVHMDIDNIPALQSLVASGQVIELKDRLYKGCREYTFPQYITMTSID